MNGLLIRISILGLLVVGTALAVPTAAAPGRGATDEATLQRALDELVAAGAPGAVALVREGDRTIRLTSGYGNLKTKTPMRATDRFRIGSITKTFVATVVLQLVGDRKLRLTDSVERWLPGLVPNGRAITVRQLLNHTSGLFSYDEDREFLAAADRDLLRKWTPRELVAIATAHEPRFAPGAGWSYSGTGYIVLGLIVEKASGNSLASELRRRIFAPLRLQATSLPTAPRIAGRYAHGYYVRPLKDVSVGSPSVAWAAGALVSNADDLAEFFRALLRGRLLRPGLLQAMETTIKSGAGAGHGLGLGAVRLPCGTVWGFSGGVPGYSTHSYSSKDGWRQAVVLVNVTGRAPPVFNSPRPVARAEEHALLTAVCG
jgi:D-alanyl-D-alanine carboxypeptidase